ncbi:putative plant non-specific lipid-transfer protein/Par allergen [Helianthus annuus]|nr:putative plant non-specific lipid-transfer protein/Par allergen [Helianthus annuus]
MKGVLCHRLVVVELKDSIMHAAKLTPDRQTACGCLKSVYASNSGINLGFASNLPGKCGVNIPYKISPSTDCSTVH